MSGSAREAYLAGVAPERRPIVEAIDGAIMASGADFDVAVKYRMLMYALDGHWRYWVVAIDAHPKSAVAVRFLNGVSLADPGRHLRAGSSTLMTLDVASLEALEPELVSAYVREAVAQQPDFVAADRR